LILFIATELAACWLAPFVDDAVCPTFDLAAFNEFRGG